MATSDPEVADYKISYWTFCGDSVEKQDGEMTILFKEGLIFRNFIEKQIGIESLRWVSRQSFEGLSEKDCIVVSYLDNVSKDVANIFFELKSEAEEARTCFNTMRDLLTIKYQGCTDDQGKISDVVNMVFNQPIFMGRTKMIVHTSEEGKIDHAVEESPGEMSEFLMIIDIECMCLYRGQLNKPVHELMFWEEESLNSIERVKLTQKRQPGSLPEKIVYFQTKTQSFGYVADTEIVKQLQNLTAKKRHIMTEPQLMLEIMPKLSLPSKQSSYWSNRKPQESGLYVTGGAGPSYNSSSSGLESQIAERLNGELENALVTFMENEDMQNIWVAIEFDIKEIIESGTAPTTDHRSGGMDSDSGDHLQKALQDVMDQLQENNLPIAISRIKACRDLFGSSSISAIRKIFDKDDVHLLKSLYFKSLLG